MMYLRLALIGLFLILMACKSEKESQQTEAMTNVPRVTYVVPEGWVEEEPANAIRKAQFRLPGVEEADDAQLTVFVFPGGGGTIDANINRWYRQFKQPDGSNSAEKAKLTKFNINNLQVTVVSLTGTYLKSVAPMMGGESKEVPESKLLAAIVETNSAPWFFKAVGPEVTINHWRESFDQLVQSFVYK
jgi:hypothetical protein